MALQFRKGTYTQLQTITPLSGEPIWTTDNKQLYVGDGVTQGGIAVGSGSGYVGSMGYTGSQGAIGYTGSQGTGYTGSAGFMGSKGYTGSAALGFPAFLVSSNSITIDPSLYNTVINVTSINIQVSGTGYVPNQSVLLISSPNGNPDPTNYISGFITTVSGQIINIGVYSVGGSGSFTEWSLVLSGFAITGYTGSRGPRGYSGSAGSTYNQSLNTTDNVTFAGVTLTNSLNFSSTATINVSGQILSTNTITSTSLVVSGNTANTSYDYLANNGVVSSSYYQTGLNGSGTFTLDTFDATAYTSAKYFIQLVDSGSYQVTEISLVQDGTNVYKTEYGMNYNNGLLGTFGATINTMGGNWVQLQFTPFGATNLSVRIAKTKLAVL